MSFHLAEAPLAICCCSPGQGFLVARVPGCRQAGTAFPSEGHTGDGGWGGELEVRWGLLQESLLGGSRGKGRVQIALSRVSTSFTRGCAPHFSFKIRRRVERSAQFGDDTFCFLTLQHVGRASNLPAKPLFSRTYTQ